LLDDGAIAELPERLGAPERAVDGAVASGPDQRDQVRVSRVHARAAGRARRVADPHEGVADGDHAFPAAALERGAIGVVPDANGDIDAPARELRLDDAKMGGPDTVILVPARRHGGFAPLDLFVDRGASAEQRRVFRVRDDQASPMHHDSDGDGAQPQKAGHHNDVSFEPHCDLLHYPRGRIRVATNARRAESDVVPSRRHV
jgi:hypothetical protein